MAGRDEMNRVRAIWVASRVCATVMVLSLIDASAHRVFAQLDNILVYRGADRQQQLIDGAKQEGHVTIYTGLIVNVALRPLIDTFMQKYPFIKVNYLREE